jgi:hypothetical protein
MVGMYLTTCKGMAWNPPIPIYPVLVSSSSESESEYEVEIDSEGESKWGTTDEVVSNVVVD